MKINKITCTTWIVLLLLVLNSQSCQIDPCGSAPADLIENMEDLVKEVKKKDFESKDDRWKEYDERFQVYFEDCYDRWSPDMTGNQKREFAGLTARYMANRFGKSFFKTIFGDKESNNADTKEFFDNMGTNLKKFIEKNDESGRDFIQDLKEFLSEDFDNDSTEK